MTQDTGEPVRSVPIEQLDLRYGQLRLANPVRVRRLRLLLEAEGMRQPLLGSDRVAAGTLVLIDGFKRLAAARELGRSEVLVRVLPLDAVAAEVAMITANAAVRGLAEVEEGFIVHSLHRNHGRTQVEIGQLLSRHKSWVCRRLSLVEELAPDLLADLRLGLISATVGRELARLPRGNQTAAARAVAAHHLSSRQASGLVTVLHALSDPRERQAVLDNPLAHLPARAGQPPDRADPRLGWLANRLRRQMLWMEAASDRIVELLRRYRPGSLAPLSSLERRVLGELAQAILPQARAALAQLEVHLDSPGRCEDERSS